MVLRWLVAVMILPGTALVLVPAAILFALRDTAWGHSLAAPSAPAFWVGIVCAAAGLALGVWTASLFARFGAGTAAPWDPPRRFVVRGPYRHVRNPMITGALAILLGESLIFQSWPLFLWFVVFALGNALYIPLVEERGLVKRFGQEYAAYRRRVPRWIPRLTPWAPG